MGTAARAVNQQREELDLCDFGIDGAPGFAWCCANPSLSLARTQREGQVFLLSSWVSS